MFLAFIIPAFLGPCFVPTAQCEPVKSRLKLSDFGNGSLSYQDIIFSPFASSLPLSKLYFLQSEFPNLLVSPKTYNLNRAQEYKNGTKKDNIYSAAFNKRNAPARVPRVHNSKDYGKSSHYSMKETGDSSKKSFYMNLLQKLLRDPQSSHSSRKENKNYYISTKHSSPMQSEHNVVSYGPMEAAGSGGWGWSGWKGGGGGGGIGGGGHGHGYGGISLADLLLAGLSLLSLGGFLLNLLLNLLNLFGFGMNTSTSTYPVTVTQTQTGGTTTGGGTTPPAGSQISLPTTLSGSGLGFTGRTIDMVGNGWGWGGKQAYLKGGIHLGKGGWGWPSTTTTTTAPPVDPTLTGTGGAGGLANSIYAIGRKKRRKREMFEPYVNPSTALNIFAKAVLNSIDSAANKYECMEKIFCENNKQARVIGEWLDYFMPVYRKRQTYFWGIVSACHILGIVWELIIVWWIIYVPLFWVSLKQIVRPIFHGVVSEPILPEC